MKIPTIAHPIKPKLGHTPLGHEIVFCCNQNIGYETMVDNLGNFTIDDGSFTIDHVLDTWFECNTCGALKVDDYLAHGLNEFPEEQY
jgi:hypothetical protein